MWRLLALGSLVALFLSGWIGSWLCAAVNECVTTNDVNKVLLLSYSGAGIVGWPLVNDDNYVVDCFSGERVSYPHSDFPKGADFAYCGSAHFWCGGIVVPYSILATGVGSLDSGFQQYEQPILRSILDPGSAGYSKAISEQDIISTAEDTARPSCLHLKVIKTSLAWTYQYAEDLVLYDVEFRNIGSLPIKSVYVGPHYRAAVGYNPPEQSINVTGGIGGYRNRMPSSRCQADTEDVSVAWFADLDGNPINGSFGNDVALDDRGRWTKPCPSVGALVVLGYPEGMLEDRAYISFNWWVYQSTTADFGPERKDHRRSLAFPWSDGDTYYMMSNGEIDYDILHTAGITQTDPIWKFPPQELARGICTNGDVASYLLSVGPYDLNPGESFHVAYALVFGEHFHSDPTNRDFLPDYPDQFYAHVDFRDLYRNIEWAKWIYDNPGVDTDSDGYAGDLYICNQDSVLTDSGWVASVADTFFATGDGVPDWRPVSPPPSPELRLEPLVDGIGVYFNGYRSETTEDVFSGIADFEGYSVYVGRDQRDQSLSLVASYDKEDYDRYVYNPASGRYEVYGIPLPLDSLRCLYSRSEAPCADSTFDPLAYELPSHPYVHPRSPDSLFNFRKNSYNVTEYPTQTSIHKVYPDAPDPRGVDPEDLTPDYFTEDGRLKFFEYECEIHGLLSSVQYYVSVTAFDFGMPGTSIKPLESAKSVNATSCFVYATEGEMNGTDKQIYVYPNPYRASEDYRAQGYEGRTREDQPDYRTRAVNFANLPPKCTISIYSLDGDLVRRIDHDYSPNDPNSTHDYWDVITRNTEAPVSGLYYWVVEIPGGPTQIGKLVLIM